MLETNTRSGRSQAEGEEQVKSLKKLHAEAIEKAKTEQDKIKAAAVAMIETPIELIKAILLKHEQAVIEVMRELHEENIKLKNREWVGLTDEERKQFSQWAHIDVVRRFEELLRERNK